MRQVSIIQVVDSLEIGGMESVAVNFANLLAHQGLSSSICSTRRSGPLQTRLSEKVTHLNLARRGLVDFKALRRFTRFLREQRVDVIHAHGTALFFCSLASLLCKGPKLIWHVHFGRFAKENKLSSIYRLAARRASGVIAVNQPLASWVRDRLNVPPDRVWYLPNFVVDPQSCVEPLKLPGIPGKRVVCIANVKPEKGHLPLLDAMAAVVKSDPHAVLFIGGNHDNQRHTELVKARIRDHRLEGNVFLFGLCENVWPLLKACDIGVLPSIYEGLPLALLEYGTAGLPAVATQVGQVPEVLDNGRAGLLVEPGQHHELAAALLRLLKSGDLRQELGSALKRRVRDKYSQSKVMEEIGSIYEMVLGTRTMEKVEGDGRRVTL